MKKETARELNEFAKEVAQRFSKTNREQNWQNETFTIKEIIPTSDQTACVIFKKDSGKLAAFFFITFQMDTQKDGDTLCLRTHT